MRRHEEIQEKICSRFTDTDCAADGSGRYSGSCAVYREKNMRKENDFLPGNKAIGFRSQKNMRITENKKNTAKERKNNLLVLILILCVTLVCTSCAKPDKETKRETVICVHESWENGKCINCGLKCNHARWNSGKCILCGMECAQHEWKNGKCTKCHLECEHPEWKDSVCTVCEMKCTSCGTHIDPERGICSICGGNCQHLKHDQNGICKECKKQQLHRYVKGKCEICEKLLETECTDIAPEQWYVNSESGIVERIKYTAHNYTKEKDKETGEYPTFEKQMTVYLPAGYDPSRDYNVLLLLGGTYANDTTFLINKIEFSPENTVSPKNLIDNMIAQKKCAPLIVVGINMYAVNNSGLIMTQSKELDKRQITNELRYDILPYIAKHYNTYMNDSDEESIRAAREHIGLFGISYGCIQMYNGILPECLDLIGWYTAAAGGTIGKDVFVEKVKEKSEDYPISYFYSCVGDNDSLCETTYYDYEYLEEAGVIKTGENASFDVFNYTEHNDRAVGLSLYNTLMIMFSSEN